MPLLHRLRGHAHADHSDHRVFVGRKAASYDRASGWFMRPIYRSVAKRIIADVPLGGRVLDVGTGPGRLLLEIARCRPDVHVAGVDPSADMVGRAEAHARSAGFADRVTAHLGSAEKLPFADGTFDVVVSSLSAHHWADVQRGIAEQARVLSVGGHLWVCDLRHSTAKIAHALTTTFGPARVTQPRLRGLAGIVLACHRAGGATIPPPATAS